MINDPTTTDFTSMYTDDAALKTDDPVDKLFTELSSVTKSATTGAPATQAVSTTPVTAAKPASTAPKPAATATTTAAAPTVDPTGPLSPQGQAVLARVAPLGIKNLADLRKKSDVELRKLSGDVINYEMRQASLAKSFQKNADGSWDFTTGPDGTPTGLGPDGKALPKEAATPAKPAPGPAKPAPAKPGSAKPAPKPSAKPTPKRVTKAPARKAPAKKKTVAPKRNVVRAKPKPKPVAKKPAPKKTAAPKVTIKRPEGRGALR